MIPVCYISKNGGCKVMKLCCPVSLPWHKKDVALRVQVLDIEANLSV